MEDVVDSNLAVREALAKFSGTQAKDWFLCLKQRFGMAEVYKAISEVEDPGEVITTPYTCITAINPIIVGGHKPIYADIDPLTLSTGDIPAKLFTKKARAVVMQHTLGIVSDKLAAQAKTQKTLLIEDSAHALLRFAKSEDGEILADISAHSFGVEKIIPGTKFGGAIYLNPRLETERPALYAAIIRRLGMLPTPDKSLARRIKHYRTCNAILQRSPHNIRPALRNFAIKAKILEPAVYPFEQEAQQTDSVTTNDFVNQTILKNIKNLKSMMKMLILKKELRAPHCFGEILSKASTVRKFRSSRRFCAATFGLPYRFQFTSQSRPGLRYFDVERLLYSSLVCSAPLPWPAE